MRTRGVKLLDPVLETAQIDWLVLPVEECRDEEDEGRVISSQFRKPHEPWGHSGAVCPPGSRPPQPLARALLPGIRFG